MDSSFRLRTTSSTNIAAWRKRSPERQLSTARSDRRNRWATAWSMATPPTSTAPSRRRKARTSCSPSSSGLRRKSATRLGKRSWPTRTSSRVRNRCRSTASACSGAGSSPSSARSRRWRPSMPNPVGSYIWYELMTSDVDGAKTFYDAVVGWDIKEGAPEFGGYRMIGRADGGFAGGGLPITDDMASHGAKPRWLGYVYVDDVDRSVASFEAAGGLAWMLATDIPTVGRVALVSDPQAAPIYVMKPSPRTDDPDAKSDVFSPDSGLGRCGWNELQTSDVDAARQFYGEQFGR